MNLLFDVVLALLVALAVGAQLARWLRVLQREHYDPRSLARFVGRWSAPQVGSASALPSRQMRRPISVTAVALVAWGVALILRWDVGATLVSVVYGLACPPGLSIRGRTSPLQWTRRLRLIAATAVGAIVAVVLATVVLGLRWYGAAIVVWLVPLALDLSVRMLHPFEERVARRYAQRAHERLARVAPRVVAITGSFGKTSTKNHVSDLVGPTISLLASPRSFNNRAGLSRTINEQLSDDARVFVAEMGTYGPGEIRQLCEWCAPDIAVVTAIGPVHLERMGSLDVIESAKFEITERASIVVVNADDDRLRHWPDALRREGKRVVTAGSTAADLDVAVRVRDGRWTIVFEGRECGSREAPPGMHPSNVACALAVGWVLGVDPADLVERVDELRAVDNRQNIVHAASGVLVIDDTFNANPESARSSLDLLARQSVTGRRVVVTPGLIELGRQQYEENLLVGRKVAGYGFELVVVARTNALALASGFGATTRRFDHREDAVAWVRSDLSSGDAVLYLNDLPDHYP